MKNSKNYIKKCTFCTEKFETSISFKIYCSKSCQKKQERIRKFNKDSLILNSN